MNCLQVDISLLSNCLCAEVTNLGDGLKLEVNNLSGLLANVNLYNDYIKPIVSDTNHHLELSCSIICTIDLVWDYLFALDGILVDFNGEKLMVKKGR